jgi:uncharacterized protein (TIGR02444 family)
MPDAPIPETPFWRFSIKFYAVPDVAPACLTLQDAAGIDVNLLMYLLWSASRGRAIAADEVRAFDRTLAGWRDTAVIPLRTLRRALKSAPPLLAPAAAERYRNKIKGVELEAERLQQEAMFALDDTVRFSTAADPATAARTNVAAYQAISPQPFDAAAVDALLAAFDGFVLQHGKAGDARRESA